MNDLRTRIAYAIAQADGDLPGMEPDSWDYVLADAVIAELRLKPQVHYDPECEFYRYVTDWIDPQTNQRVDLP